MKRYRERLKADTEKWQQHLENERKRDKKRREEMKEVKYKLSAKRKKL